ncbi:hypothetical protein CDAR_458711 [Caerostris darwini]|uniref:Uncharacterized protein n=1 Tax=Caerostris darwini TaxID=1538125 RepID=A0AAV4WYE5_9ARAC|nr:hypothetical protein CDAR_458711 [Caerostris darwini]
MQYRKDAVDVIEPLLSNDQTQSSTLTDHPPSFFIVCRIPPSRVQGSGVIKDRCRAYRLFLAVLSDTPVLYLRREEYRWSCFSSVRSISDPPLQVRREILLSFWWGNCDWMGCHIWHGIAYLGSFWDTF